MKKRNLASKTKKSLVSCPDSISALLALLIFLAIILNREFGKHQKSITLNLKIIQSFTYTTASNTLELNYGRYCIATFFFITSRLQFHVLKLGKYLTFCSIFSQISTSQVKSGTIFDNILVTDDVEYAKKLAEDTWGKMKDAEKEMFEKAEEERKAKEEEERK